MALIEFQDYVFLEKVWMMVDDGVFVGTQNYLFCIPSKQVEHQYRKVTTTKFSFKGKEIKDAVRDIIAQSSNVEELENNLLEVKTEFEEMIVYNLNEVTSFKVQAGFLGSGIHVKPAGKRGYSPFIQRIGSKKKEVYNFYKDHPKRK